MKETKTCSFNLNPWLSELAPLHPGRGGAAAALSTGVLLSVNVTPLPASDAADAAAAPAAIPTSLPGRPCYMSDDLSAASDADVSVRVSLEFKVSRCKLDP